MFLYYRAIFFHQDNINNFTHHAVIHACIFTHSRYISEEFSHAANTARYIAPRTMHYCNGEWTKLSTFRHGTKGSVLVACINTAYVDARPRVDSIISGCEHIERDCGWVTSERLARGRSVGVLCFVAWTERPDESIHSARSGRAWLCPARWSEHQPPPSAVGRSRRDGREEAAGTSSVQDGGRCSRLRPSSTKAGVYNVIRLRCRVWNMRWLKAVCRQEGVERRVGGALKFRETDGG